MSTPQKLYRISTDGTEIGSFDIDTLCTMWESEAIPKDTLYFHERSATWKSLVKIFEARAPGAEAAKPGPQAPPSKGAKGAKATKDPASRAASAAVFEQENQPAGISSLLTKISLGIGIGGTLVTLGLVIAVARQGSLTAALSLGLPLLLATAITAALHFGLGQILALVSRIAVNSERAADAAERKNRL